MLPEPLVSTADQTKRGLWGREWLFSGEQKPEVRTKAETVKIVRGLTENRGQKTAKSVLRRLSRNRQTAF